MTKLYKSLNQIACYTTFLLFWMLIMTSFSFSIWQCHAPHSINSVEDLIIELCIWYQHLSYARRYFCSRLSSSVEWLSAERIAQLSSRHLLLFHLCFLVSSFYSFLVSSFAVVEQKVCRKYILGGSTSGSTLMFVALVT